MHIEQITSLLKIGDLAIKLHAAQNIVDRARRAYIDKLKTECEGISPNPQGNRAERDVIEITKEEYAAWKEARRAAYNIKRRLQLACRKHG